MAHKSQVDGALAVSITSQHVGKRVVGLGTVGNTSSNITAAEINGNGHTRLIFGVKRIDFWRC